MRKNMLFVLLLTMGAMLANANSAAARQRTTEALATKPEAVPAGLPKTEAAPAPGEGAISPACGADSRSVPSSARAKASANGSAG